MLLKSTVFRLLYFYYHFHSLGYNSLFYRGVGLRVNRCVSCGFIQFLFEAPYLDQEDAENTYKGACSKRIYYQRFMYRNLWRV